LKFNKALIKSKTGAFVFWEGGVELKYSEGKIYLIQNFGRNISRKIELTPFHSFFLFLPFFAWRASEKQR